MPHRHWILCCPWNLWNRNTATKRPRIPNWLDLNWLSISQ
jgi:hypothetical protein